MEITRFLAAQLGLKSDDLAGHASREETRHEHLAALRDFYGYKMFTGPGSRDLKARIDPDSRFTVAPSAMDEGYAETTRTAERNLR